MKTYKEIANLVLQGIIDNNTPARDPESKSCFYRYEDADGCKNACLVGRLILDECYDKSIEDKPASWLSYKSDGEEDFKQVLRNSGIDVDDNIITDILDELQDFHDVSEDTIVYSRERLSQLAQVFTKQRTFFTRDTKGNDKVIVVEFDRSLLNEISKKNLNLSNLDWSLF